MRSLLIAVAASAVVSSVATADIVTQWNFNDNQPSTGGTLTPSTGTGTASAVGAVTTSFVSGSGSSDPAAAGDNDAWSTATYAAQGTGSGTRGVRFDVSTVGYSSISISFDQRNSNTGSQWWAFEYSLDGSTFNAFGAYQINAGSAWFNGITFDLSSVAGADNNALFAIRMVAIFAPGSGGYTASNPTSNYGTSGTARFDMVTVNGTLVPAPGALALLGVAGLVGGRRRRA